MIGRIQDKNASVPVQETFPTETILPNDDGFVQDPDFRAPRSSVGVARVPDSFEEAKQNDLLEILGPNTKSIIDPIGYPGEEWLWETSEEL